jgi:hypothetical protein
MLVATAGILVAAMALETPAWAEGTGPAQPAGTGPSQISGMGPAPTLPAGRHAAVTARIQELLDHPVNGIVNLPPGRFSIRPVLRLQQGVRIVGHRTTLRVAWRSGNYLAMLAGVTPATDLSGLTITGVTFDQNSRRNPVFNTASLLQGKPRFIILVSAGSGIAITGNRFVGIDGLNSVVTGGGTQNVTIGSNVFHSTNTRGHDHSSIYTSGTGTTIRNNRLTGTAMYSSAAIEVHGKRVSVTGNHIAGYPRGANIVASRTTFTRNTVVGALSPVDLWSVESPGLRHVAVTTNKLGRNPHHWARVYRQHGRCLPPHRYNRKVIRDELSSYPMYDITVRNNRR